MSGKEKGEEIYYLKRDLEDGRLENRDMSYAIDKLRKQRTLLVVIVILQIMIIIYLFFKAPP